MGALHGIVGHRVEGSALEVIDCTSDGLRGSLARRREFNENGPTITGLRAARDQVPSFETIKDPGQRGRPRSDRGTEG